MPASEFKESMLQAERPLPEDLLDHVIACTSIEQSESSLAGGPVQCIHLGRLLRFHFPDLSDAELVPLLTNYAPESFRDVTCEERGERTAVTSEELDEWDEIVELETDDYQRSNQVFQVRTYCENAESTGRVEIDLQESSARISMHTQMIRDISTLKERIAHQQQTAQKGSESREPVTEEPIQPPVPVKPKEEPPQQPKASSPSTPQPPKQVQPAPQPKSSARCLCC